VIAHVCHESRSEASKIFFADATNHSWWNFTHDIFFYSDYGDIPTLWPEAGGVLPPVKHLAFLIDHIDLSLFSTTKYIGELCRLTSLETLSLVWAPGYHYCWKEDQLCLMN
jgi:hypothetical protein